MSVLRAVIASTAGFDGLMACYPPRDVLLGFAVVTRWSVGARCGAEEDGYDHVVRGECGRLKVFQLHNAMGGNPGSNFKHPRSRDYRPVMLRPSNVNENPIVQERVIFPLHPPAANTSKPRKDSSVGTHTPQHTHNRSHLSLPYHLARRKRRPVRSPHRES